MHFDRRNLIKAAGSLAIFAGFASRPVFGQTLAGYPLQLGVASGDPHLGGFVLWTCPCPQWIFAFRRQPYRPSSDFQACRAS